MIVLGFTLIFSVFLMVIYKKKHFKFIYIAILLMLTLIAFYFNPIKAYHIKGNYTDLFRFFNVLDNTRFLGYDYLLNHSDYSSLFIARWYVYILSLFEDNRIFTGVTCLLEYGLIFYTINNFSKKNHSSKLSIILCVMFFLLTIDFLMNITNVRTPLVFSIYFFCIYREFIEARKNKFYILIYFLLCFLHPIAMVLLIFRVVVIFYNKHTEKLINTILLTWSIGYYAIIPGLSILINNPYINQVSTKLNYYENINENIEILLILSTFIKIILCYIMVRYFRKEIKVELVYNYKKFYNLAQMFIFFTLGSYFQYHMFLRFSTLLTYFIIIFIQINLGNVKYLKGDTSYIGKKSHVLYRYILFILIILSCAWFSIYFFFGYSYKRIVF